MFLFRDRTDAGRRLAELVGSRLERSSRQQGVAGGLVLGLPRGGVPVAAQVATALGLPLDVLVVRKVGVPSQPELALGAVGERGVVALNANVVSAARVGPDELEALVRKASQEVEDVVAQLRPVDCPLDVRGRMAIVVDDGVATGATARAAASVLRQSGSGPVILATPVAALSTRESLGSWFDEVICLHAPLRFGSVGQHYQQFEQVSIAAVRRLLGWTAEGSPARRPDR
jgi:putative phosphoribosyl transferase